MFKTLFSQLVSRSQHRFLSVFAARVRPRTGFNPIRTSPILLGRQQRQLLFGAEDFWKRKCSYYVLDMADNRYSVDYAKRVAGCKKCKQKMEKGQLRIAKITASPFSDDGEMKNYHHPNCIFETFKRARPSTKIIEEPGDIEGFADIQDEDKDLIKKLIKESAKPAAPGSAKKKAAAASPAKKATTPAKKATPAASPFTPKKAAAAPEPASSTSPTIKLETRPVQGDPDHKDNSFREFRRLCALIAEEPSYNAKTEIVSRFFLKGSDGKSFQGDLYVWVRLLLPGVVKRIYNVQSKQLVKIFSKIFGAVEEDMLEDLENGDVADTVAKFFESSGKVAGAKKSKLTVHRVDDFLDGLAKLTREEEQGHEFSKFIKLCTTNDLKMVIRLIKHDLRIQAGAKHILEALHKDGYEAFNSSRNIVVVIDKVLELRAAGTPQAALDVGITLMHPVQPMLAQACKSVDMAFQKCPNGMYSEIKYDGERVQLHKQGSEFKYYSRSLKPVLPHKVKHFKDYIPTAFPDGSDLILDAEVLMVDNKTGDPLPFGTLGKHKAGGFSDATPCLFVFDCIFYNGKSLMNTPIKQRRKFLTDHMVEVGNHVKFSEMEVITKKEQLGNMIKKVLKQGLEGLVLKDVKSIYEPGKRHWLKVKKDYLNDGAMADSADLVVLGGWYGTGSRGGILSVFLMGTYSPASQKWYTVTKVHTGHDDETLDRLQGELMPNMKKIKSNYDSVPSWLECSRQMAPDFVAIDPKKSPVWEITGAEFSKADLHTAAGISIRFPRVTKIRDDKTWETSTSLPELKVLFQASKESTDFNIDYSSKADSEDEKENVKKENIKKEIKEEVVDEEEENMEIADTSSSKFVGGHSYNKTQISTEYGLEMKVVNGDLFSARDDVSLAHCISRDCRLGKGIAKIFKDKFGRLTEIRAKEAGIGEVAELKVGSRFVYNLVTKEKYSDKPTYHSLRKSLEAMRSHALSHGVTEIAMPKIGCGLDGLHWNAVRTLIKNVFLKDKLKITIYELGGRPDADEKDELAGMDPKKRAAAILKAEAANKKSPGKKSPVKNQPSVKEMFGGTKRKSGSDDEEEDKSVAKKKVKKEGSTIEGLPDVFDGLRILLGPALREDEERLRRYVVSFGGEILQSHEAAEATHVIHGEESEKKKATVANAPKAQHVTESWLVQSIKKKERLREEDFEV